jgi:hypothetical protein
MLELSRHQAQDLNRRAITRKKGSYTFRFDGSLGLLNAHAAILTLKGETKWDGAARGTHPTL